MKVQPINLGAITVPNNIFLAPMAGYTDYAFRTLALMLGAGLCFTELTSAKGTVYKAGGTAELLHCEKNDIPRTAAQLFGSDPYYIRAAAESEELSAFEIIDLNMGCPVPKIFKNGEGSALLKDILRAEAVVKAAVKSGKVVTVKIRTGLVHGDDIAAEYCKMAENAGAKLVTIHGRVREDYYSGEPDYAAIARAKSAVSIPIIANGGIFTAADAEKMIDKTGADGVMLARGAVENPLLISELTGNPPAMTKKEFIYRQIELSVKEKGELRAAKEFRKFAPYYLKGLSNAKAAKIALSRAESAAEVTDIINSVEGL